MNIVTDALNGNLKHSKNKQKNNEGKPSYWIKILRSYLHPSEHQIDQHLLARQTAKPQQVRRSHGSQNFTTPLPVAPSQLQDPFRNRLLLAPRSDQQCIVPFRYFPLEKRLKRAVKAKSQGKSALSQPVHRWKAQAVDHHYYCISILQQFINDINGAC